MGSPPDFYEVLSIPKNSSPEEIRNAYKILAKKWHPDKHPPSSKLEAEARFKAITQAYEVPLPFNQNLSLPQLSILCSFGNPPSKSKFYPDLPSICIFSVFCVCRHFMSKNIQLSKSKISAIFRYPFIPFTQTQHQNVILIFFLLSSIFACTLFQAWHLYPILMPFPYFLHN